MTVRAPFFRLICTLLPLLAAMAFGATPAQAQSASATGGTEATVLRRLSFIRVDDMLFGRIIPGTTAGTVVIAPNGTRTGTGGVILLPGGTGHQPSAFAGWGTQNQNVQISMGSNSVTLTRSGGTQTMVMDTFIIGSTPTAQLTTVPRVFRISSATGVFEFPLGATLRVGANQVSGLYQGTYSLTLNYQ